MDYLTALFCQIDDFCKEFEPQFNRSLIESRKTRNRKSCISTAEIITVWIYFHHLRMRDFKTYYLWQIKTMLRSEFPYVPSYNRFVEPAQRALPAMLVFLKTQMGHRIVNMLYFSYSVSSPCRTACTVCGSLPCMKNKSY